jgi:hypothetical protein
MGFSRVSIEIILNDTAPYRDCGAELVPCVLDCAQRLKARLGLAVGLKAYPDTNRRFAAAQCVVAYEIHDILN